MDINDHITNIIVEAWDGSPLEYEAIPFGSGMEVLNLYINKILNDKRARLGQEDLSDEEMRADIFKDEETGKEYMVLEINNWLFSTIVPHTKRLKPSEISNIVDRLYEYQSNCTVRKEIE